VTDKEKRQEIRIWLKFWQQKLNLINWQIIPKWKNHLHSKNRKFVAETINTNVYYRTVKVNFYLPAITQDVEKNIYQYTLHEIVHVLFSDYDWIIENFSVDCPNELYVKTRENMVENLTSIILKLMKLTNNKEVKKLRNSMEI